MNSKVIWTNYKIYAFILGIILGTVIYNFLGIDFSFDNICKIQFKDSVDSFIYTLIHNLKFWSIIFCLSFFSFKDKLVLLIVFYYSFLIAGIITVSVNSQTMLLLHGCVEVMSRIWGTILMCDDTKKAQGRILSFVILIIGTFLENLINIIL